MTDEREIRNQVFAGPGPHVVAPPTMSVHEQMKKEFDLEIPDEVVPLPSGGKTYPANHSFCGRDRVDIKAMTAREEDILTNKALLKKGTVITELIRSCLVDKSVDPTLLLAGDRNALMVAIRITGYGVEYHAEIECPECEAKVQHEFDLSQLPISPLMIEPKFPNENMFEFKLPYTGKIVLFKFMTGRDEEEISMMHEKQKKLGMANMSKVTTSLQHSILSVGGVDDRGKIATFVRNMPARDSLALRNYIRANEPGIKMAQEVTCASCGHSDEAAVPIGITFLWPGAGR